MKPFVLIKCAMSIDGFIDDSGIDRLILSTQEDFIRADAARAECDAILVGANTIRRDDPRLRIKSEASRQARKDRGEPVRVTLTLSGNLSPEARFFASEDGSTALVYTAAAIVPVLAAKLGSRGEVVAIESADFLAEMLEDLWRRGMERVLVEGGSKLITGLLTCNLVDELEISLAPFFVGDEHAPRFVESGNFPFNKQQRMTLVSLEKVSDMAVMRYRLRTAA